MKNSTSTNGLKILHIMLINGKKSINSHFPTDFFKKSYKANVIYFSRIKKQEICSIWTDQLLIQLLILKKAHLTINSIKTFTNICMKKVKLSWILLPDKCFWKDKRKCSKKLTKGKIKLLKKTQFHMKSNFKKLLIWKDMRLFYVLEAHSL